VFTAPTQNVGESPRLAGESLLVLGAREPTDCISASEPAPNPEQRPAKPLLNVLVKRCAALRVAEVVEQDIQIKDGKVELYRVKLKVSFKFDESDKD
jgi:hypothetical protein